MTALGLTVLNNAAVGAMRIPTFMLGAVGGICVGELARRALANITNRSEWLKKLTDWVFEKLPTPAQGILAIVNECAWTDVAKTAAVCLGFHVVFAEAINCAFGAPHPYYNTFLEAATFLKVNDAPNFHNPLVQMGINLYKGV
jgi:hypothetical protein